MTHPDQFDAKSSHYQQWKNHRLRLADTAGVIEPLPLTAGPGTPTAILTQLCTAVQEQGFVLYEWTDKENATHNTATKVQQLHTRLSLISPDQGVVNNSSNLALLKDSSGTKLGKFIPYTSRAMGWHTDGYYNDQSQTLRCFTLHCISQALDGGALSLVDYELMFIALNDENPDLVTLLQHPEAMTLPANKDDVGHDRPDRHCPVFYCHADGTLGTRFTTRTTNIHWRNNETKAAAARAAELVGELAHHTIRLKSGQGIITRNILHRREAFTDDPNGPPRQMLRGRYMQAPSVG